MMYRMVDGNQVELSPEEEAEVRASWVSPPENAPSPRDAAIDALIAERARQPNPPPEVMLAVEAARVADAALSPLAPSSEQP